MRLIFHSQIFTLMHDIVDPFHCNDLNGYKMCGLRRLQNYQFDVVKILEFFFALLVASNSGKNGSIN